MEDVLADGTIMLDTYMQQEAENGKAENELSMGFCREMCGYFLPTKKNGSSHAESRKRLHTKNKYIIVSCLVFL
jgi:hypothetical protein